MRDWLRKGLRALRCKVYKALKVPSCLLSPIPNPYASMPHVVRLSALSHHAPHHPTSYYLTLGPHALAPTHLGQLIHLAQGGSDGVLLLGIINALLQAGRAHMWQPVDQTYVPLDAAYAALKSVGKLCVRRMMQAWNYWIRWHTSSQTRKSVQDL